MHEVSADGVPLVLSNLVLSEELLNTVYAKLSSTFIDQKTCACVVSDAFFDHATITEPVLYRPGGRIQGVAFFRKASFQGAHFPEGFTWSGVYAMDDLIFSGAKFDGPVDFTSLKVQKTLQLDHADVRGKLDVRGVQLKGLSLSYVWCNGFDMRSAEVDGEVSLVGAVLDDDFDGTFQEPVSAHFSGATLRQNLYLDGVHFPIDTRFGAQYGFDPIKVANTVFMNGCFFGEASSFGVVNLRGIAFAGLLLNSTTVYGQLDFSSSTFGYGTAIQFLTLRGVSGEPDFSSMSPYDGCTGLVLDDVKFSNGFRLLGVRTDGYIAIDKLQVEGDLSLAELAAGKGLILRDSSLPYFSLEAASTSITLTRCHFEKGCLLSLNSRKIAMKETTSGARVRVARRSSDDVARLVELSNTDAEGLILQDLDLSALLFSAVVNLDKLELQGNCLFSSPKSSIASRRRVIRDEIVVLAEDGSARRNRARDVASIYRSLRKGREDKKDEPGGADFYYGEMEMRRRATRFPHADHLLISLYWVISGYGLRATRAIIAAVGFLVLGALVLRFQPDNMLGGYVQTVSRLLQVSIGLDRIPSPSTVLSSLVYTSSRLVLPGLLALAALAIRGRVKR